MSLKRRQKISPAFSMSSMTDLIFLLLIFFIDYLYDGIAECNQGLASAGF